MLQWRPVFSFQQANTWPYRGHFARNQPFSAISFSGVFLLLREKHCLVDLAVAPSTTALHNTPKQRSAPSKNLQKNRQEQHPIQSYSSGDRFPLSGCTENFCTTRFLITWTETPISSSFHCWKEAKVSFVRTLKQTCSQDCPRAQLAFKDSMIHGFCNSHYVSHFAAFFIVAGA